MKILVALLEFPIPSDRSDKVRALNYICYLHRHHEVYVVCQAEQFPPDKELLELTNYCNELHIIQTSRFMRYLHAGVGLLNGLPHLVNFFFSTRMRSCIRKVMKLHQPDLVLVESALLGRSIPFGLPSRYMLDYVESISYRYRRRALTAEGLEKYFVAREAERLADYETRLGRQFQMLAVSSERERHHFDPELARQLHVMPNGVSDHYLQFSSPVAHKARKYHLLFTGNMSYRPNVQGCLYLVNRIVPLLEKKYPDLKVCLAGSTPAPAVMDLENHRSVTVTGFVPDLREYLRTSQIYVAPLFGETGLPNKLLEAMATGLPVLVSPEMHELLGTTDGEHLYVCADENAFADRIRHLLTHEKEARAMGQRGRQFVEQHYNWEACNQKLELSLTGLVQQSGAGMPAGQQSPE